MSGNSSTSQSGANARPGVPKLHTTGEAAEILRVRQSWLERQAAARRVPFTMLGGSYRFTDDHLEAIIRLFEKVPGTEAPPKRASAARRSRMADSRHATTTNGVMPLRPRPRKSRIA